MKILNKLFILFIGAAFISGCSEDPTETQYEQPITGGPQPVITSVTPNSVYAGDDIISINGSNFIYGGLDTTRVYLGSQRGQVISITNNLIQVKMPTVYDDILNLNKFKVKDTTVSLKIFVPKTSLYNDEYKLTLLNGVNKFGQIDDNLAINPKGLAVNKSGDLLVSYASDDVPDGLRKITSDGIFSDFILDNKQIYSMKFGPGDSLYSVIPGGYYIYIYPPNSAAKADAIRFPTNKHFVKDFDFDASKNIWAVCDFDDKNTKVDSIFSIARSNRSFKSYPFTGIMRNVRVFSNALYIAANVNNEEKIYRAAINANGSLETPVEYFNITANIGNIMPNSMTFDAEGNLYFSSDNMKGIVEIKTDKSITYRYDKYFNVPLSGIQWGTDNYLYACVQSSITKGSVLKINMRTQGAPYYGRE